MRLQLGIGIVTTNHRLVLSETLDHVPRHTKYPFIANSVAADGSTDGSLDMLRGTITTSGRNKGIAWHKDRTQFMPFELMRCDVVILPDDDPHPPRDNNRAG